MTSGIKERNMVIFMLVVEEFNQIAEIKESFPKEEFQSKDLKDIDAFFVGRKGHYKQREYFLPGCH